VIKSFLIAALAVLTLAGCGKAGGGSTATDPYAGLETEFLGWRTEIEATHPGCRTKVDKKGCEAFQITCKAQQEITPDEAARGITAQIVAAMTFTGRSGGGLGSSFAVFSKAGDAWSRAETSPVNLSTCAPA
jgi:hypothetical protein